MRRQETARPDGDYVLGTDDVEVARLGLQHRVWRETMLAAWRRGGLRPGMHAVDVGAGPGFATLDLAEIVGAAGRVTAVERSPRFVAVLRDECARRGLARVEVREDDLMARPAVAPADFAWCRWVASFVPSVEALAEWLGATVRPGGRLVMHEYVDYGAWRWMPERAPLREFVAEVMASWRASGGEPDVAPRVLTALAAAGFRSVSVRPHVFATRPDEHAWRWPASFVAANAARLVELGRVTPEWARDVEAALDDAERDAGSVMITPMVLEMVAERE